MRVLADMIKSDEHRDPHGTAVRNLALIEIVVSQVLAVAAYKGQKFTDRTQISAAVHALDGYPILNLVDDATVQEHATRRIAWLIGLPSEV